MFFAGYLLLHVTVWTLLPTWLYPNLPLDVIEALIYGREWQLGHDKLPPLPWWLVEIAYQAFNIDFAYYALGQISVAVAFMLVWATARPLVGSLGALCAILIIDGQYFMNFDATKFNHNVVQLPFWALAGYAYWSALRTGRIYHWLLLGVAVGGALWAKYFIVVLAIPLVLFLLVDSRARRTLATRGPWLALITALALVAPHLAWLIRNDFVPFAYANAQSAPRTGAVDHILYPLQFSLTQIAILIPCLVVAAPLVWRGTWSSSHRIDRFDRRIVTVLAFGPAATLVAISFVSGRGLHAGWGYPLWIFVGLWIVVFANAAIDRILVARVALFWATIFSVLVLAFMANVTILPRVDHRYLAAFFPGEQLGTELSRRFREATGQPIAYVIADRWIGGNVAHYAPERPRLLLFGSPQRSPWIDLRDLKVRGAVVIWAKALDLREPRVWMGDDVQKMPPLYQAFSPNAQVQSSFRIPFHHGNGTLEVGWALLRPEP